MSNEVKVIQPSGRLDVTTAAEFRRQVNDIASATNSPKYLLVDLQEISFMCGANDQVQMLFELTSMTKIFKIYPTIDEFNATLS